MPNINDLKTRAKLEIADLPDPSGVNIVKIARFDTEEYQATEGKKKITKNRWVVYFEGYPLPFRLYNGRLDTIAAVLGSENTEDWYGRKIGLTVGQVTNFGETELDVVVYPFAVDPNAPVSRQRVVTIGSAAQHNALPPMSTPPAARTLPAGTTQPANPAPAPAGSVGSLDAALGAIGKESAAKMLWALKSRAKTWQDLLDHLKRNAADHGCQGVMPYEVPRHVIPWYQQFCRGFPAVNQIDQAPFIAKTIAEWTPPPPPPANEVIDKATGEVMRPATAPLPPEESDIPF